MTLNISPMISSSKLNDFQDCPYYFQNGRGKGKTSKIMREGKRKHKILEDFVNGASLEKTDLEWVTGIFQELSEKMPVPTGDYETKTEECKALKYECQGQTFIIDGIIDLQLIADEVLFIYDYKTGFRNYSKDEVSDLIQGKIYSLLGFADNPKINTIYFGLILTEYKKVIITEYKREDISTIKNDLNYILSELIKADSSGIYEATPNNKCAYCPVIKTCKNNGFFRADLIPVAPPTNKSELENLIKRFEITKKYLGMVEETIKETILAGKIKETKNYSFDKDLSKSYTIRNNKKTKDFLLEKYPQYYEQKGKFDTVKIKKRLLENVGNEEWQEAINAGLIVDSGKVAVEWNLKKS